MRYFFHYRDSTRYFADAEGTEFGDLATACSEGRESARELLPAGGRDLDSGYLPGAFEISDLEGTLLATVPFDEQRLSASGPSIVVAA